MNLVFKGKNTQMCRILILKLQNLIVRVVIIAQKALLRFFFSYNSNNFLFFILTTTADFYIIKCKGL